MTFFEATNSVFDITDQKKSFSITTPADWCCIGGAELINKLQKLLEMRHSNDIELLVQKVRKGGNQRKIGDNEPKSSDHDTRENRVIKELKNAENNDIDDMVFRMELIYSEIEYVLHVNYIDAPTAGYTLSPGIYEVSDFNWMLKSLFPKESKKNITIDDSRLRSELNTSKTIRFI